MRPSRRLAVALVPGLLALSAALPAQDLRTRIGTQLFTFGTCGEPLCLAGSLGSGHGLHFIPADLAGSTSILAFLGNSIGASVDNTPITSASSGTTFEFVNGAPVKTSTSAGPIFGERAQTLGRGQFYIGMNVTQMHFERLRGIPVNDVIINFTHQNVAPTDTMGSPSFENDVVQVQVAMNVNLLVSTLVASYGLVDGIDLSIAVPVVRTSIEANSVATILPLGGLPSPHFFAGTAANPIMTAVASTSGAATGIGDIAARAKINITQTKAFGTAVLLEGRFPTGDANNLLGSGSFSGRGELIASATFGQWSPHANLGYVLRDGDLENNSILANIGFDQLVAPRITMGFDLLSDWELGASKLVVPPPVQYQAPYPHVYPVSNIPNQKDNFASASVGFKFTTQRGIVVVTNALFPLRNSGLQPSVVWSGGLEYSF
jgi:hypothetical protein